MRYKSYLRGELVGGIIFAVAFIIVIVLTFMLGVMWQIDWNTLIAFTVIELVAEVMTIVVMYHMYRRRILK